MEQFFFWVSQLSKTQAIVFISAIVLCMVLLPYATFIVTAVKILIQKKKLEVLYFDYFVSKEQIAYAQSAGGNKLPEPNFIMEGSPVILHWRVEGALKLSISPGIGRVKGNSAQVIVSKANRTFTLQAIGLFGKQTLQVEIPSDKIKSLHSAQISDFEVSTQVRRITSFPISGSLLQNQSLTGNLPHSELHKKLPVHTLRQLWFQRPIHLQKHNEDIRQLICEQNIVKNYSFSTQHFENHNKFLFTNIHKTLNHKHPKP